MSLTPELEQYAQEKVSSGLYYSASEVIREGLRLLKEREQFQQIRLQELRQEIQVGLDSGEVTGLDGVAELWYDEVVLRASKITQI
ncbi:addiction module antidote protein, CC2985 family [Oscillatoria nigro-viridis PCC 7112]|uniref:Addiction module antidote protein, CC2985 family n=1 Tax=Phormidium nigroviride PCC 7112 TaxID=179408 RepID=K9VPQ9_9CYAN|nr:type II toxin-antitoxin system ParD family antitoxin [Oscillatoria nigro-viridis]AFZ09524.1 addiction module antidote protein, CC2985 family [Oscillatoria nigro-viridis PCC 7112]